MSFPGQPAMCRLCPGSSAHPGAGSCSCSGWAYTFKAAPGLQLQAVRQSCAHPPSPLPGLLQVTGATCRKASKQYTYAGFNPKFS